MKAMTLGSHGVLERHHVVKRQGLGHAQGCEHHAVGASEHGDEGDDVGQRTGLLAKELDEHEREAGVARLDDGLRAEEAEHEREAGVARLDDGLRAEEARDANEVPQIEHEDDDGRGDEGAGQVAPCVLELGGDAHCGAPAVEGKGDGRGGGDPGGAGCGGGGDVGTQLSDRVGGDVGTQLSDRVVHHEADHAYEHQR